MLQLCSLSAAALERKGCLPDQVSPSSPGHGVGGLPPAHRRVMREAEPANSGHSGHTPRAQAQRPEHPDGSGTAGPHSAFDFQQVRPVPWIQ